MRKKLHLLALVFFIGTGIACAGNRPYNKTSGFADSSLILIPFQFQQSALYHAFTYEVIDSVAALLLKNEKITLSIRGFAHADEGTDSVCKWLSEDRALFVKKYIMGRGVEENRIVLTCGMGAARSAGSLTDKNDHVQFFRAELVLNFPPPPPPVITDRDEDGILNENDHCPDIFGYADNKGCPDSNAFIIPFANTADWLSGAAFRKLDTLVKILQQNPSYTISIQGHAYKTEGNEFLCRQLAGNRAAIVKRYLLSRNVAAKKILAVSSYGSRRPLNAAKNPAAETANCRAQVFIYPEH